MLMSSQLYPRAVLSQFYLEERAARGLPPALWHHRTEEHTKPVLPLHPRRHVGELLIGNFKLKCWFSLPPPLLRLPASV